MKAQIFKYAHKIAKDWSSYKMRNKFNNLGLSYRDLFAEALKLAYKKITEKAVKNTVKIFASFVNETEKAYLLSNGTAKFWCPKSLMIDVIRVRNSIAGRIWKGLNRYIIT